MKQRQFGRAGFQAGEVGLGCWQLGGDFGPMEKETAAQIMSAALDSGTTFFDTADVYGDGRSESLIGNFLIGSERRIHVATKFGREAHVYPDRYTEKALRDATEASLRRLKVETLDLTQLHCVPIGVLRDGSIFEWLRRLKTEGKITRFGASVETIQEALLCLEQEDLSSLQIIFNIFRQKPLKKLLPLAKEKGVAVIVRLPLASGLLSGKFTTRTKFVETDHRNFNRDGQKFNVGETFAGLPFEKGVALADAIKSRVPPEMTMAQMALRWVLDHDAVTVVIPGASSPGQARANAEASRLPPLSGELHRMLSDYYENDVKTQIRGPY